MSRSVRLRYWAARWCWLQWCCWRCGRSRHRHRHRRSMPAYRPGKAAPVRRAEDELQLDVEWQIGHLGEPEPVAFMLGAQRVAVLHILDRWPSSDCRYVKLAADDGACYILRHDHHAPAERWSLTLFQAVP